MSPETTRSTQCDVHYDGACPLCRAEIGLYQRLGSRARFHDISAGEPAPEGVSREAALKRFHVTDSNGQVRSGARAFAELWKATPGFWRPLGHVAALPPFVWAGEALYRAFLLVRPQIQRFVRKRAGDGGA